MSKIFRTKRKYAVDGDDIHMFTYVSFIAWQISQTLKDKKITYNRIRPLLCRNSVENLRQANWFEIELLSEEESRSLDLFKKELRQLDFDGLISLETDDRALAIDGLFPTYTSLSIKERNAIDLIVTDRENWKDFFPNFKLFERSKIFELGLELKSRRLAA